MPNINIQKALQVAHLVMILMWHYSIFHQTLCIHMDHSVAFLVPTVYAVRAVILVILKQSPDFGKSMVERVEG